MTEDVVSVSVSDECCDDPRPATVSDMVDALLGNCSVGDLLDAKAKLEGLLETRVQREYDLMRKTALEIAQATRVPVEQVLELLAPKPEKKARTPRVAADDAKPERVKYRHPEHPELTWSGRGREPKWLVNAREEGFNEMELLAD